MSPKVTREFDNFCLDGLSRLKGIETSHPLLINVAVANSLDGLSRLKGIETESSLAVVVSRTCLDGLSRLKGIETFLRKIFCAGGVVQFGWTFPLEGN